MTLERLHLLSPPLAVFAKRLLIPRRRKAVEAGLDDGQQRSVRRVFQLQHDERRWLVWPRGLRARMPTPREAALGNHLLDHDVPRQVLVALDLHLLADAGARRERRCRGDTEP